MVRNMINANKLKIIAIICMVIDHIGYFYLIDKSYSLYLLFRSIGRIAMPIFVFLLVEGYNHTKSLKKYILRLSIIAVITQIINTYFDIRLIGHVRQINIVGSFVLILLILRLIDKKVLKKQWADIIFRIISLTAILLIYFVIDIDYSYFAPILAMFYYITSKIKNKDNKQLINLLYIMIVPLISIIAINKIIGLCSIISAFLILLYDGTLGKKCKALQYTFYLFFPVHYFILYSIKLFLFK